MTDTPFSSRDFRDALSTFATGVTIVTATDAEGEPVGMTASSFNSVSMDPPLILWSVTKTALSGDAFKAAGHFAVHILANDQVDLSNRFARSGTDKFGGLDYSRDANNVPLLAGAATRFDCSQWATYEGGDHWIIVGRVENIESENMDALVFSAGSYATASPLRPASTDGDAEQGQESAIDGLLIYNLSRAYRQVAGQFHHAVRACGLTLSEWRILASLHGETSRSMSDLAARTFVDPKALRDMVSVLEEAGLCSMSGDGNDRLVSGTAKGHERVDHLFALSMEQEKSAVGKDADLTDLIMLLKRVIANTDS